MVHGHRLRFMLKIYDALHKINKDRCGLILQRYIRTGMSLSFYKQRRQQLWGTIAAAFYMPWIMHPVLARASRMIVNHVKLARKISAASAQSLRGSRFIPVCSKCTSTITDSRDCLLMIVPESCFNLFQAAGSCLNTRCSRLYTSERVSIPL